MNETERLRIKLQAAEAEILRLQQAIDDIKEYVQTGVVVARGTEYANALYDCSQEINKITKPL